MGKKYLPLIGLAVALILIIYAVVQFSQSTPSAPSQQPLPSEGTSDVLPLPAEPYSDGSSAQEPTLPPDALPPAEAPVGGLELPPQPSGSAQPAVPGAPVPTE